jgi:hypothetical protein
VNKIAIDLLNIRLTCQLDALKEKMSQGIRFQAMPRRSCALAVLRLRFVWECLPLTDSNSEYVDN